jgi:hypothetical protein
MKLTFQELSILENLVFLAIKDYKAEKDKELNSLLLKVRALKGKTYLEK